MTSVDPPRQPRRRPWLDSPAVVLLGICALAGLVLSLVAGWVWVSLADPPSVPLAANGGLYLGEQELDQQSGVTLWFLVVGAAFGAVAGLLVGWFGRRVGWPAVPGVLLLCTIGTVASRYLGVHVFGPDAQEASAHAAVGTLIRLDVSLDTWVAYLGWPIGGVLGVLAAIACWSRSDGSHSERHSQTPPPSPTLYSPS